MFCMSNPAIFTINEVTVGITTNDILFHLSGDEVKAKKRPLFVHIHIRMYMMHACMHPSTST